VRLAADANVLLAAVLGGRARLILESPRIEEVLTAKQTFDEVQKYAVVLAREKRLPADILLLAVTMLPVTVIGPEAYSRSISEARRRIARRDPDDVEILALALHFDIPVWSNDKDFLDSGVQLFTTEDLLRKLGMLDSR
jgi:predicted nucleic acid-binding protein